ncbi:hypothetical protein DXC24_12845 [Clostridium sp. OM08-29]|nr:hypothetical protein DXC24_12845 [Clostridium sp. OM08-29]
MVKKRFCIVLTIMALCLTGCSRKKINDKTEIKIDNNIEYVESLDELEENTYYVVHDGKYEKPYIKNASFDIKYDTSSTLNEDDVAWYMEDFSKIPTLYSGDYIVYYTSEEFNENFYIRRYEYLGYTVGISKMERLDSGRYAFGIGTYETINPDSDANRLKEEGETRAIIDNIGGAQLRSGNVSKAGTIIGLSKNKSYAADVYIGTELKSYILKADSIALRAMETDTIKDYTFLRSKVIRLNLPDYLNDGYYDINGSGIFRYVKGTSYTDSTDFNVPNIVPEQTADAENVKDETQDLSQDANATVTEQFTVNKEGTVTVTVTYGELSNVSYDVANPTSKVIGNYSVYTLSDDGNGQMKMSANLKAGTYKLEISGLYGRSYKYEVTQAK